MSDVLIVLPPIGQPSAYERTLSVYRLPVEGVMTPSSIGNTLKSVFKTGSSVPDSSGVGMIVFLTFQSV